MKKCLLFFGMSISLLPLHSQDISHPDIAFKSHQTLELLKISRTSASTTLVVRVTSLITNGSFCVDPATVISLPNGEKLLLENTVNIPNCPQQHHFLNPGESLTFSLQFPSLPETTQCIDVLEGCDQDCFSLIGVITDPLLNEQLNEAQKLSAAGDFQTALKKYMSLLGTLSGQHLSAETGIFSRIIQIYHEEGNTKKVKEWIDRLTSEKPPYYQQLVEDIKESGLLD